nr:TetR/AcrR family transcriptional regulator [Brevibacterium yomogidense]
MDETKLSKSLSGARRFQPDELFTFATVTGVTVSWLLTGTDSDGELTAAPAAAALPAKVPNAPADRGLRRRRIIEEAWNLFAERGYDHVRMADIAQAADVSAPAVNYHFTSKWEIFVESMRYSVKLAYDRQLAELGEIADPVERLRALVQMQMPHAEVERKEWSIWVQMWAAAATSEAAQAEHANSYSRWERTVRDVVAECIEAGAFRPMPLESTVLTLTGLIDGLGIRVLSGLLSSADMRATVLDHIDDHLVAEPHGPPGRHDPAESHDPPGRHGPPGRHDPAEPHDDVPEPHDIATPRAGGSAAGDQLERTSP